MTDTTTGSDPLQAPPLERGEAHGWLHDVRNAANSARMAVHVAERLLRNGERDRALVNLARAREACDRLARMTAPAKPFAGNGGKDPHRRQAGDATAGGLSEAP